MNNLFLGFSSLIAFFFGGGGAKDTPYMAEGKQFLKNVDKELKKNNFYPLDSRGNYNTQIINFSFGYYVKLNDIDEEHARELFIFVCEKIYEMINKEKSVVHYLRHYPYNEQIGFISLSFFDKNGCKFKNDKVVFASVYKGVIEYSKDGSPSYIPLFRESYATAYEKVMGKPLIDRRVMYGIEAIEETKQ